MSKETAVAALGFLLVLIQLSGFPGSWKHTLVILTGLAILVLGFFLRAEALSRGRASHRNSTYTQNNFSGSHENQIRV